MAGLNKRARARKSKGIEFKYDKKSLVNTLLFFSNVEKVGKRVMNKVLLATSKLILRDARLMAPEDTGSLIASGRILKPKVNARNTQFDYTVVFGGIFAGVKFVDYAQAQEDIHHFLSNAETKHGNQIEAMLAKEMKSGLSRVRRTH